MGFDDRPQCGQGVWTDDKKNGVIIDVDYEFQTVLVKYYNDGSTRTFEWDELLGCWQHQIKQWVIVE